MKLRSQIDTQSIAQIAQAKKPKVTAHQRLQNVKKDIKSMNQLWNNASKDVKTRDEKAALQQIGSYLQKAKDAIASWPKRPAKAEKHLAHFRKAAKIFLKASYNREITTVDQDFGKAAGKAKTKLDNQLNDVFRNLKDEKLNDKKLADANSALKFYEKNARIYFKALERKVEMQGCKDVLDPISKGTDAHLNKKLDEAFREVGAGNPVAAASDLKAYEKSAYAALQLGEIKQRLDSAEDVIGQDEQKRFDRALANGMNAVKADDVNKAHGYARAINRRASRIFEREERRLTQQIRSMPGSQSEQQSVSAPAQQQTQRQPTQRTRATETQRQTTPRQKPTVPSRRRQAASRTQEPAGTTAQARDTSATQRARQTETQRRREQARAPRPLTERERRRHRVAEGIRERVTRPIGRVAGLEAQRRAERAIGEGARRTIRTIRRAARGAQKTRRVVRTGAGRVARGIHRAGQAVARGARETRRVARAIPSAARVAGRRTRRQAERAGRTTVRQYRRAGRAVRSQLDRAGPTVRGTRDRGVAAARTTLQTRQRAEDAVMAPIRDASQALAPTVQRGRRRIDQLANRVVPQTPQRTQLARGFRRIGEVITRPFRAIGRRIRRRRQARA
jgi:hypothetical protein